MWADSSGRRRRFKRLNDAQHVSYKRFRRRILHRGRGEAPAASTPLTTRGRCGPSFELDPVCQRLELDSPPRHLEAPPSAQQGRLDGTALAGGASQCVAVTPTTGRRNPDAGNLHTQGWVWRAAAQAGFNKTDNLPFAPLDKDTESLQGRPVMRLAAPSLLDDYYTNVLDCSCNGVVALALGSSVHLWDSETSTLLGSLGPSPRSGGQSVSSLCWSYDGRLLCVGTRRGEIQLWDVEQKRNMRCLPSHLSVVRALSWKQQLLSSGCVLGRIHHLDVRAPAASVGVAVQKEGVCSLQWSPGGDWLASGSADGLLRVWDGDVAGLRGARCAMKQPSAVKAVGWCPWQRTLIATGGGWKDGALRVWNSQTGTCVTSVSTNSQICSLRWARRERYLVTGHGLPHHQVRLWEFPSFDLRYQLTGHSHRVLHVTLKPDDTQIISAGADQRLYIWDL